jgi:hypothetical protein
VILLSAVLLAAIMSVPLAEGAYPADPTADIAWLSSCGYTGVSSIHCAFNSARSAENSQLGTSVPALTLPSQSTWNAMSDGEKVLWLVNHERSDRGVVSLTDVETNVTGVAETYAHYLLDNDCWGHECDGRTPWQRLSDNPDIGACHDFLSVSENLAAFAAYSGSIPLPVEQSVYEWMYKDTASSWGHRHTILWYPYNDNSGAAGMEGFLGIGRVSGSWQSYPVAEIIVMNVFDPCAGWADADGDGIPDDEDNCPMEDNPGQEEGDGDCIGDACDPEPGVYDPSVPDSCPPQGNNIGDACDCEGNFNCSTDRDVDGSDASSFKADFGRGGFTRPCTNGDSCKGDFSCDGDVDGTDASLFKQDFGRSAFSDPCPVCSDSGTWCSY